ncbi:MAG: outer membrane beta-barrel protein [Bacteroidia bacterium]
MPFDQFERKISARFAEAQIPPRPEVWQNIEKQLVSSRSRRKGFFWLMGDGLFAAILFWGFISYANLPNRPALSPLQIVKTEAETVELTAAADCIESAIVETLPRKTFTAEKRLTEKKSVNTTTESSVGLQITHPVTTNTAVEGLGETAYINKSQDHRVTTLMAEEATASSGSVKYASEKITISAIPSPDIYRLQPAPAVKVGQQQLPDLKIRRWAFYLQASPEWAFDMERTNVLAVSQNDQAGSRSFDYSSFESSFLSPSTQFSPGEILSVRFPRAHFQAAAGGEFYLRPNLSLQAGLGYAVSEYGIFRYGSLNPAIADQLANNPSGQVVISFSSFDFQPEEIFRTEQLELPVGVNYYLRRGRSSLVLSAGISGNRLVSRRTNYKANALDIENSFGRNTLSSLPTPNAELLVYRKYHLYTSASATYQYQVQPQWAFFTGPQIKYQLTDVFAGSAAEDQLPYRFGWQVGVRFFPGR